MLAQRPALHLSDRTCLEHGCHTVERAHNTAYLDRWIHMVMGLEQSEECFRASLSILCYVKPLCGRLQLWTHILCVSHHIVTSV